MTIIALNTSQHWPYAQAAVKDATLQHLACHIDQYDQAQPGNPWLRGQQFHDQSSCEGHQQDGEAKPEDQHKRIAVGDGQGHRYIGNRYRDQGLYHSAPTHRLCISLREAGTNGRGNRAKAMRYDVGSGVVSTAHTPTTRDQRDSELRDTNGNGMIYTDRVETDWALRVQSPVCTHRQTSPPMKNTRNCGST